VVIDQPRNTILYYIPYNFLVNDVSDLRVRFEHPAFVPSDRSRSPLRVLCSPPAMKR
jgi:hypothetical protein